MRSLSFGVGDEPDSAATSCGLVTLGRCALAFEGVHASRHGESCCGVLHGNVKYIGWERCSSERRDDRLDDDEVRRRMSSDDVFTLSSEFTPLATVDPVAECLAATRGASVGSAVFRDHGTNRLDAMRCGEVC